MEGTVRKHGPYRFRCIGVVQMERCECIRIGLRIGGVNRFTNGLTGLIVDCFPGKPFTVCDYHLIVDRVVVEDEVAVAIGLLRH
ncbi:MAG TPA: hypothetical protein VMW72_25370 [Sedimentisphaerales bacterium]|nr:hypothetical protein [Sedimentisphaerales bacterium]